VEGVGQSRHEGTCSQIRASNTVHVYVVSSEGDCSLTISYPNIGTASTSQWHENIASTSIDNRNF